MHHAGSARRQNDIRLMHQFARQLQARVFDAADDAFRCARLDRRFINDARGFRGAFLGTGMRADEDGVAGLQAQQRLEDGGRRRVSRRNDRRNQTDWLGNLLDAECVVLLDDTDRLRVAVSMINILTGIVILDDLVLHHTHAGFFHSHFSQRNARLVRRHRRLKENMIHLLLRKLGEFALCRTHDAHALLKCLNAVDRSEFLHTVHPPERSDCW